MDESTQQGNQGEEFERYRVLLFSIAYRMTGSASDAEDLVQETYLRYQASAGQEITSLKAYLSTITTRLALDHLKSARVVRGWTPKLRWSSHVRLSVWERRRLRRSSERHSGSRGSEANSWHLHWLPWSWPRFIPRLFFGPVMRNRDGRKWSGSWLTCESWHARSVVLQRRGKIARE